MKTSSNYYKEMSLEKNNILFVCFSSLYVSGFTNVDTVDESFVKNSYSVKDFKQKAPKATQIASSNF